MKNLVLFIMVILIAAIPLIFLQDAEFGGADGQAEEAVKEVAPDYTPWIGNLWEAPSGEIESLLFSVQTAIGAIIIGYAIGFGRARKKYTK
ncbi:energy-coupling factor ABC transporter substrate-binding protein [Bacillus infantis]|jgi:cobalt/nickel transport protein|uniref:energy-coupling factor ABC transporter substrate-binding protein n=1 Tax=Bacillus infantis TaxID=324767 RepID=UPI003CF8A59F